MLLDLVMGVLLLLLLLVGVLVVLVVALRPYDPILILCDCPVGAEDAQPAGFGGNPDIVDDFGPGSCMLLKSSRLMLANLHKLSLVTHVHKLHSLILNYSI